MSIVEVSASIDVSEGTKVETPIQDSSSVLDRIARIRERLSIPEDQLTDQPEMERTFSQQTSPLFKNSWNQVYSKWGQTKK